MWELAIQNRFGALPKRKFIPLLLAAFALVFTYLVASAPVANAADAQWETGSLKYEDKEFKPAGRDVVPDGVDIPENAKLYMYVGNGGLSGAVKEIIFFSDDADINDLSEAQYITFRQNTAGRADNIEGPRTITIDTATAEQSNEMADEDVESGASSCKIDGGLGWIICPLTTTLAKAMDWVFGVIEGFLEVRPLQTSDDNAMYRSWAIMRSVANIAFVIVFLIIIYAQVTTLAVSNYGIKKLLPRLIIAAILVNLSYWICAIAIDLSNILGISLQQVFINMRNVVLGSGSNSWDLISWESVAGFALSGGALGGAVAIGTASTLAAVGGATVTGASFLLLPILLGALLAVLVVMLILTARQALLTILVIVAPLAFVAYLLPNTEKWFDKWRGLFLNMLILFPAFSMVFGGAQLAGILIIQNAKSITEVILGMAVQVAPLAIVPLLLKLGGNVLTRIAGIVNNPNRGMIDRAKKYSQMRFDQSRAAGMRRNRSMSTEELKKPRNALRRYALWRDDDKREREGLQKVNESMADSMFMQSDSGQNLHEAEHTAETLSKTVKVNADAHIKNLEVDPNTTLHADKLELDVSQMKLDKLDKISEEQAFAYRAGTPIDREGNEIVPGSNTFKANPRIYAEGGLAQRMETLAREVSTNALAAENAKRREHSQFTSFLKSDDQVSEAARVRAGGIEGLQGANRALATAINQEQSAYNENVNNAVAILTSRNYDNQTLVDTYLRSQNNENEQLDGLAVTDDLRAAITRKVVESGDAFSVRRMHQGAEVNYRPGHDKSNPDELTIELADSIEKSKARPKYFTAGMVNELRQGNLDTKLADMVNNKHIYQPGSGTDSTTVRTMLLMQNAIKADKYNSAATFVEQPKEYIEDLKNTLNDTVLMDKLKADDNFKPQLARIRKQIEVAVTSPQYRGQIGDKDKELEAIYNRLADEGIGADQGMAASYEQAKKNADNRS